MPRVILRFENRVLKECPVGLMMSIGRVPDNTVIIDNPAVSSHHACIFQDGDHFMIEDLGSTNGTFVNQERITRQALKDGDVILVGKHTLVFDENGGGAVADEAKPLLAKLGETVFLNTAQYRALLNTVHGGRAAGQRNGVQGTGAVLRVRGGHADQPTYALDAQTAVIGKSNAALVRLRGWFKPPAALSIARTGDTYVATELGGKTLVNGRRLSGRRKLEDGDVLRVCGLTLEFSLGSR